MAGVRRRVARTFGAASCVREPLRFVGRELAGRRETAEYRLRGSDLRTVIRHPLLDMWVLEEVFRDRGYTMPESVAQRLQELDHPARVMDLGGHIGLFALFALEQLPDATLTSFEPDPDNAASLRRCVQANALEQRWEVVEAATGTKAARGRFISDFHLSQLGADPARLADEHESIGRVFPFLRGRDLLESRTVTVEVVDVFPWLGECDLLKVDIQGGEWELLLDPRFESIGAVALVLELHPDACQGRDARALVRNRLQAAGFRLEAQRGAHEREWVVWAVRPSIVASPAA